MQMTDTERITLLEQRDERREREHREALERYAEFAATRDELRRDIETAGLTTEFFDKSIEQLRQLLLAHPGGVADAEVIKLFTGMLREVFKPNNEAILRIVGAIEKHAGVFEQMAEIQTDLTARVEALERLIAPALRGEAVLLAQAV